jgi:DNA-binding XRE family transcriptional regulator
MLPQLIVQESKLLQLGAGRRPFNLSQTEPLMRKVPRHQISREDIEGFVAELLSGKSIPQILSTLSMEDVSPDVRLCNCFKHSGASNLRDFLELGERRFSLKNYGRISEQRFRQSLIDHFATNPVIVADTQPTVAHRRIINEVLRSSRPWSVLSEREWKNCREKLLGTEVSKNPLYPIATRLGGYWPFAHRKTQSSSETVDKYLHHSLKRLKSLRSFGRRKIASYIACVVHLCEALTDPERAAAPSDIKTCVLRAWEHTKLTKAEKSIIEQRFGIHTRKHTLEELASMIGVTRERIRQIEKKAITKLKLAEKFDEIGAKLGLQKMEVWQALTGSSESIKKSANLDILEDNLPFEFHLAIELCADRRNRGIKRAAIGDWLTAHFRNDESNWYRQECHDTIPGKVQQEAINPGLASLLSEL